MSPDLVASEIFSSDSIGRKRVKPSHKEIRLKRARLALSLYGSSSSDRTSVCFAEILTSYC